MLYVSLMNDRRSNNINYTKRNSKPYFSNNINYTKRNSKPYFSNKYRTKPVSNLLRAEAAGIYIQILKTSSFGDNTPKSRSFFRQ